MSADECFLDVKGPVGPYPLCVVVRARPGQRIPEGDLLQVCVATAGWPSLYAVMYYEPATTAGAAPWQPSAEGKGQVVCPLGIGKVCGTLVSTCSDMLFMGCRDASVEGYGYDKWVRQQVVKLACAQHISTPFFIVIDADMFAVHPFKASDVFHHLPCDDEVAVCSRDGTVGYHSKNDVELTGYDLANVSRTWHQEWCGLDFPSLPMEITVEITCPCGHGHHLCCA